MNALYEYNRHAAELQIWLFVDKPQGSLVGEFKNQEAAWAAARNRAAELVLEYGFECEESAKEIHLWLEME